jgi:muramoyltetrapeptide carboxypeptidase
MTTEPIVLTRDPAEPSSAVNIKGNATGIASGPLLGGLLIGHGNGQLTVPLGAHATIDTTSGTLTIDPGVR